jgi:hypothetical protein
MAVSDQNAGYANPAVDQEIGTGMTIGSSASISGPVSSPAYAVQSNVEQNI